MKHMTLTVSPEESIGRPPQFAWWSPFLSSSYSPCTCAGLKGRPLVRLFSQPDWWKVTLRALSPGYRKGENSRFECPPSLTNTRAFVRGIRGSPLRAFEVPTY